MGSPASWRIGSQREPENERRDLHAGLKAELEVQKLQLEELETLKAMLQASFPET